MLMTGCALSVSFGRLASGLSFWSLSVFWDPAVNAVVLASNTAAKAAIHDFMTFSPQMAGGCMKLYRRGGAPASIISDNVRMPPAVNTQRAVCVGCPLSGID